MYGSANYSSTPWGQGPGQLFMQVGGRLWAGVRGGQGCWLMLPVRLIIELIYSCLPKLRVGCTQRGVAAVQSLRTALHGTALCTSCSRSALSIPPPLPLQNAYEMSCYNWLSLRTHHFPAPAAA